MPTLTEVVDLGATETVGAPAVAAVAAVVAQPAGPDPDWLVEQVLLELAPRIEMLLEARLRETLAPALARAADGLIRDTRASLAGTLRELVEEAAARAITRRGGV